MVYESPETARQLLGSMVFGAAFSFLLHGVTTCQVVWYFRAQSSRSSKIMTSIVAFAWLAETLNCIFLFFATRATIFLPAKPSNQCGDWTGPTQAITTVLCTFCAEGFFTMRVWRLSEHKKLAALLVIPYLTGYGFGVAHIVRSYRVLCHPTETYFDTRFLDGVFVCGIVGDGAVALTMCYILRKRSSGFTRHTNTIKIVRELILWSLSAGLLTWLSSLFCLFSYLGFVRTGYAIFYIRGGVYVNAMLAQLNARTRFQAIAEESISLSSIMITQAGSIDSDTARPTGSCNHLIQ